MEGCLLTWIQYLLKTVSTLLNIHTARIFMKLHISNWYLKTQLGFILTVSKNVQDWIHFLINIPVIIIGEPSTEWKLPWVIIIFLINAGILQYHYADAKVYKYADAEVSTSILKILKNFLKMVNRFPSSDDFSSNCYC